MQIWRRSGSNGKWIKKKIRRQRSVSAVVEYVIESKMSGIIYLIFSAKEELQLVKMGKKLFDGKGVDVAAKMLDAITHLFEVEEDFPLSVGIEGFFGPMFMDEDERHVFILIDKRPI
jgi:hypothetical protein